jgi:hypothetical protein
VLEIKPQAALKKQDGGDGHQDINGGYESEEDENMKVLKASHIRKLADMSALACMGRKRRRKWKTLD